MARKRRPFKGKKSKKLFNKTKGLRDKRNVPKLLTRTGTRL